MINKTGLINHSVPPRDEEDNTSPSVRTKLEESLVRIETKIFEIDKLKQDLEAVHRKINATILMLDYLNNLPK